MNNLVKERQKNIKKEKTSKEFSLFKTITHSNNQL